MVSPSSSLLCSQFELAIPTVIEHEGSRFTNNPNDPGGATKWGVTLYELKNTGLHDPDGTLFGDVNHDGRVDIEDIKSLTLETAEQYYRWKWWEHYRFDRLVVQVVATKVFDTSVNMGGVPAIKILQRSVNTLNGKLVEDGILGDNTVLGANAADHFKLLEQYRAFQAERYMWLISRNPKLREFRNGWLRRAAS